jgi:hypothetical protein
MVKTIAMSCVCGSAEVTTVTSRALSACAAPAITSIAQAANKLRFIISLHHRFLGRSATPTPLPFRQGH